MNVMTITQLKTVLDDRALRATETILPMRIANVFTDLHLQYNDPAAAALTTDELSVYYELALRLATSNYKGTGPDALTAIVAVAANPPVRLLEDVVSE